MIDKLDERASFSTGVVTVIVALMSLCACASERPVREVREVSVQSPEEAPRGVIPPPRPLD